MPQEIYPHLASPLYEMLSGGNGLYDPEDRVEMFFKRMGASSPGAKAKQRALALVLSKGENLPSGYTKIPMGEQELYSEPENPLIDFLRSRR